MIDFIAAHKEAITLMITSATIGVIVGATFKGICKLIKNVLKKLCKQINIFFRFVVRKIKGNYNLNNLEKIANKPETKWSKRERKAIVDYNKIMEKCAATMVRIEGIEKRF